VAKPTKQRGRWRIRWFDETGARRSAVFDDYRTALHEQRIREAEVGDIKRGLRTPRPPTRTFDDLCDYWLKHRAPRKRSEKDDVSIIRCHLRPFFGPLQLANLDVARVDAFTDTRHHLDQKTVANILTLLIAMLNCAKDLGWLREVPRIRKPKVRFNEHDFRYLRTSDEIRRLLEAARAEGPMVTAMYATAIFTGLRAGELADLTWDLVNFSTRLITVGGSFGGPTKGGDTRYVPIVDALLPILREWRLKNPLPVVFPNEDGTRHGPSARVYQEIFHRVLDRAGFPMVMRGRKLRRYLVFHDLRHTMASHWVMGGGDIFKLQKILGHKSIQMTQRYAHLAPNAFSPDYGRFEQVSLDPAEVVPLRRRGGAR
jgi:integrase